MALQNSGPISFNNINVELNFTGTAQLSLGSAAARTLAGVPSGQIRMSDFYGKSNTGTVFLSAVSIDATTVEYADQSGSALAGVRMLDSGEFQGIQNDNQPGGVVGWSTLFNWRTGGSSAPWSYRATQTSAGQSGINIINGSYTTGWVSLTGGLPQWDVAGYSSSSNRNGLATRTFTLELALTTNTSNILASASIFIEASSQTNAGEIP